LQYNSGMNTKPKSPRMGRPPIAPEERLQQRSIRLAREHWAKVDLYGLDWLRNLIERAKPPREDLDE
jgi:hypothetical protein